MRNSQLHKSPSLFIFILSILSLMSCQYELTRNYVIDEKKEYEDCRKDIFFARDVYGLDAQYRGSLLVEGKVFSKCSQEKQYELINSDACALNTNMINILERAKDGFCEGIQADYYSMRLDPIRRSILENPARDTIHYSGDKAVRWSDFRLSIDSGDGILYDFVSNIQVRTKGSAKLKKEFKGFEVNAVMYRDVSAVSKEFEEDKNLKHVNLLFDIVYLHARELEIFLNEEGMEKDRTQKLTYYLTEQFQKCQDEQKEYIGETEGGLNTTAQEYWSEKIRRKLEALNE